MKLTIILPTYNEKESLPKLVEKLISILENAYELSIIIVDDGSPDGTGQEAENLKNIFSNLSVIHRSEKLGLGSAYKEGFSMALEKYDPDVIVQMDADDSHDPNEIPNMIEKLQSCDYVVASRHVSGSKIIGWGAGRKIIHSTAGSLARFCAKLNILDPTSGYRMYKKDVLKSINFSEMKSDGFAFQVEMLCMLKKHGYRGLEIPTRFVNRYKGKSKMGLNEAIQFTKLCWNLLTNKL
jgi:dolichol-phosphate mannosyltransferase